MRPAGRKETESLYFTYPYFDAPDRAEGSIPRHVAPVAIVGSGPIGMTAALALAREGIRSVVFDNKSTFNDGSRAICVARPSYYIMEQLGYSTDDQRSGARCMGEQKCDFILSPVPRVLARR